MINKPNQKNIVSEIIKSADARGSYVDTSDLERAKMYLEEVIQDGEHRINVVMAINSNTTAIIQETMAKQSSLISSLNINPSARQYSACIRDLNLFLRYLSYAILAGTLSIIDEGLLIGLPETYIALNISIDVTVKFIQTMKEVTKCIIGNENSQVITENFDYLCNQLTQAYNSKLYSTNAFPESSQDGQSSKPNNDYECLISNSPPTNDNPILNMIEAITAEIPLEAWDQVPQDLAQNLDHYLYGVPKQE